MHRYVAGIDIGYGWTKILSSAAGAPLVYPTVIGDPNRDLIVVDGAGAGLREVSLRRLAVRTEHGLHFIGELALAECDASTIRTAAQIVDRVQDVDFAVLMSAALGLALGPSRAGSLVVVTGLPLTVYRHERASLQDRLTARHTLTFVDPASGETLRSSVVEVAATLVVPQPMGAFAATLLDEGGAVREPDLLKARVAVLDIGFGTTDLLVLRPGGDVDSRASANIPGGVRNLVHRLQRDLQADPTFRRLQPAQMHLHELEPALREYLLPGLRQDRPEAAQLRRIVDRIKTDAAHTMAQRLESHLGGSQQPDIILLAGGGSALLGDVLVRAVESAFPLATVTLAEDPQQANTRGFYRLARQLAARRGLSVA